MKTTFTRFVVVGGSSALLYFLLMWFFRARVGFAPFLATICAYAIAFCVAYMLQHRWTFRSDAHHRVTLPRYALVQLTCALLTAGITEAVAHVYPQSPSWLLAGISTVLASGLSFVLSSMWVFSTTSR